MRLPVNTNSTAISCRSDAGMRWNRLSPKKSENTIFFRKIIRISEKSINLVLRNNVINEHAKFYRPQMNSIAVDRNKLMPVCGEIY